MEISSVTDVLDTESDHAKWGYELTLDCRSCDKAAITDAKVLDAFARTLVKAIDMKPYGEPQLVHFAEHDPEAAGYPLVQLIETSSITGHFIDKNGDAYINIFSCKHFDPVKAVEVVNNLLRPENVKQNFYTRQA
jgi:S-adenosylmethionine decarboxylase